MKVVAIDVTPLKSAHRFRGIGIYTQNLVKALQNYPGSEWEIQLIETGSIPNDVDIVHYPYFDLFFPTLPIKKTKKTVVTIHDVIPLIFPKNYPPGLKGKIKFQRQKLALKSVSKVICDSECSKRDISKYLNYPLDRIFVVYLAPEKLFKPMKSTLILCRIRVEYQLPSRFVLYVGDVNYNKNIIGLAKACRRINIPLVIVGKQTLQKDFDHEHIENQPLVQLIKLFGNDPHVLRLGFVPTEDLVSIYNLATVYCQPSFYEGFGIPILEAMACGVPVVAANTGSLPEICGRAAVMIDPYDLNDLAEGLGEVVKNKNLRNRLAKQGLKQVKNFSWRKTAEKTMRVYQKIVEETE